MYNIKVKWEGAADKLLINGELFTHNFIDKVKAKQSINALPGFIEIKVIQTSPSSIEKIFSFDSEVNGLKLIDAISGSIEQNNELQSYIRENDLVSTVEQYTVLVW